jgi:cell division protein FtsL
MENNKEMQDGSQKQTWKRWLNFQSVVRQLPFILFLTALAVVYIYNVHYAEKLQRHISKTEKEVKELKYEFIQIKSEALFQGKQSEIIKAVQPLGLKETQGAPPVLTNHDKP